MIESGLATGMQVAELLGCEPSSVWRMAAIGTLPKPTKIYSKGYFWNLYDIWKIEAALVALTGECAVAQAQREANTQQLLKEQQLLREADDAAASEERA